MLPALQRTARGLSRQWQPALGEACSSRNVLRRVHPVVSSSSRQMHASPIIRLDGKNEAPETSSEGAARQSTVVNDEDKRGPGPKPEELEKSAQAEAAPATGTPDPAASAEQAASPSSEAPETPVMASTLPGLGLSEKLLAPSSNAATPGTQSRSSSEGQLHTEQYYVPSMSGRAEPFHLHIQSTSNNTIMCLTTPQGLPIVLMSCGTVGFRKAARGTYDAGYRTAMTMFHRIEENRVAWRIGSLEIVWKGFGQGREAAFRALQTDEGGPVRNLVRRMRDATSIKVGGTRAPKQRNY